ncbi:response regulator [Rhodoferax sp.]|uniref:response regulator n=1 Tax=Rhodoferax sp. TaxID=50421 RepID=UPI001EBD7C49|nr:response regulator [Rhodoferax sp.]MBT9505116.1 response regulator [Rhodoferax sp.]
MPKHRKYNEEAMRHKVIYIEDNASNLKLVTQILGRRPDIEMLAAATPEQGIALALANCPDLILVDINMPGMDGYQVLDILKRESKLENVPVIAVTANAMPRDVERGMASGFAEYLTKPLDIDRFMKTIDRHLNDGLKQGHSR